jgi:alpha-tubulin suppressor-like RCC1 family protein
MPSRPSPIQVSGLSAGVAELALGANHSCARMIDGTMRCWGSNENGQLGDGTTQDRDTPAPVPGLGGVQRIAAGRSESCAVLADSTVRCWGATPVAAGNAPAPVEGLSEVVAVALGALHACALRKDGTVACWGDNAKGQIGDGTTEARSVPTNVPGVAGAIQIAAWLSSSCALLRGGSAVCWGSAGGPGGAPQPLAAPGAVAEIAGSCTRGANGSVRCRLGEQELPIEGSGAAQIAFGVAHGCLRTTGGEVRCWGVNRSGELGDGTKLDRRRPTPVAW